MLHARRLIAIDLPEKPPRQRAPAGGGPVPQAGQTARFSLYSLAIAEAKAGAGVVMGHEWLIADDLAQGTLVRPFEEAYETGRALVLERAAGDPAPALRGVIDVLRDVA